MIPSTPPGSRPSIFLKVIRRTLSRSHSSVTPSASASSPSEPTTDRVSPAHNSYSALLPKGKDDARADRGLSALVEIIGTVKEVSDIFPPLKTAASGLLEVLKRIKLTRNMQDELKGAIQSFERLLELVKGHASAQDDVRTWLDGRISLVSGIIEGQADKLKPLIHRKMVRRVIQASADEKIIADCLHDIKAIETVLTLDVAMHTDAVVTRTEATAEATLQGVQTLHTEISTVQFSVDKLAEADILRRLRRIPNKNECLPGTRIQLLDDLVAWANDSNAPHVFWLNGMAGTGKTAIALSFIRRLAENNLLGGYFLCSRDGTRDERDVKSIFPSLSDSLADLSPVFRTARSSTIGASEHTVNLTLGDQFCSLLKPPLEIAFQSPSAPMLVLIMDALDECEDHDATKELLDVLLSYAPKLQVKFFVTSRPEPHIRASLERRYPRVLRLHEIGEEVVQGDIGFYLRHKLKELGRQHNLSREGTPWPSEAQLSLLIRNSGRFFIYASTAVKYISHHDPGRRLQRLADQAFSSEQAIGPIFAIYSLILEEAFCMLEPDEADDVRRCLAAVVYTCDSLTVPKLGHLLDLTTSQVLAALGPLHSLIYVPHDLKGSISTFHASFPEYLRQTRVDVPVWLTNAGEGHADLARGCIQIMSRKLHFNIVGASSAYLWNWQQTFPDIKEEVAYACLFWQDHLIMSNQPDQAFAELETCLRSTVLYWIEVLTVLGFTDVGSIKLSKLITFIQGREQRSSLEELLRDLHTFLMDFREPITKSVAHIYISALPFTPRSSQISQLYRDRFPNTVVCHPPPTSHNSACLIIIPCATAVHCLQYSPDGKMLATGLENGDICLWDPKTGEGISKTFHGHNNRVSSISFSSDGRILASGSWDCTIRMWNVDTGSSMRQFGGHSRFINAVAVAPDGSKIVSAAWDYGLRLWGTETGKLLSSFGGHNNVVYSVAFSSDGRRVVSGADDGTVCIWDAQSGRQVKAPLRGHKSWVTSVAVASDGRRIASGSNDRTIRIWDITDGKEKTMPSIGHTDWVQAVAFSPDGTTVVSGSMDKTVRIWDAGTGDAISEPFEGHTDKVVSVAYSPDGRRVVSGSNDKSLRIWNVKRGHKVPAISQNDSVSAVWSVSFSPDGKTLASGSSDDTVRIWDVENTLALSKQLRGHQDRVRHVSFSLDGEYIASASDDCTVRIWNRKGDNELLQSFKGHKGPVMSAVFSPDGSRVVSGGADQTIRIWAVEGADESKALTGHKGWVRSVDISPSGDMIVSGSDDQTIRIWDAANGKELKTLRGHLFSVSSVGFSPDGSTIASGSDCIRLWDTASGRLLHTVTGHDNPVNSLRFFPDGTRLVSGSDDRSIRIWNTKSGRLLETFNGHTDWVTSVAITSDGERIASGSRDGTTREWDPESTHNEEAQPVDSAAIRSVSWRTTDTELNMRSTWIVGSDDELILWVPPRIQNSIRFPKCRSILGREMVHLDFSHFKCGPEWTECASGSSSGPKDVESTESVNNTMAFCMY